MDFEWIVLLSKKKNVMHQRELGTSEKIVAWCSTTTIGWAQLAKTMKRRVEDSQFMFDTEGGPLCGDRTELCGTRAYQVCTCGTRYPQR